MNSKHIIRTQMRGWRQALAPEWVRETSARIQQRVREFPPWQQAVKICCYLARPGEVQTDRLLEDAWQTGKSVWVPAFQNAATGYAWALLDRRDALRSGPMGVREPASPRWIEPARIDLVIVPGLAFDRAGRRLGHGGGVYDRLLALAALQPAFKLGLAFENQMADAVPDAAHDIRMDAVVTEKAVYQLE